MFGFALPTNSSALSGFLGGGGFGGGGGGGRKDSSSPSSSPVVVNPELSFSDEEVAATGSYVDDGSQTSAEKARDDNLGFWNQLLGSLNGYNQKVLQDLMSTAAKAQYDYEERMSSTAYQRAVADMKKAGLNPAVLFSSGMASQASTPHVSQANVATENQLLSFFSSAGSLLVGLGNLINSIYGNTVKGVSSLFSLLK